MVDLAAFGKRVTKERRRLGLSQRELAELAGVGRHKVIGIENGSDRSVQTRILDKIATALQVRITVRFGKAA